MGAKPQPCYNRIRAINDRVIMRLQCTIVHVGILKSQENNKLLFNAVF